MPVVPILLSGCCCCLCLCSRPGSLGRHAGTCTSGGQLAACPFAGCRFASAGRAERFTQGIRLLFPAVVVVFRRDHTTVYHLEPIWTGVFCGVGKNAVACSFFLFQVHAWISVVHSVSPSLVSFTRPDDPVILSCYRHGTEEQLSAAFQMTAEGFLRLASTKDGVEVRPRFCAVRFGCCVRALSRTDRFGARLRACRMRTACRTHKCQMGKLVSRGAG